MSRTVFFNLCKYLLAFGVLALVLWLNWEPGSDRGLEHVWRKHVIQGEPINVLAFGAAFLMVVAAMCLTLVRWYILVIAQGLPFTLRDAFRLGLVGFFFNTVLPGSVGGDVVKAAGLARTQSRRTIAVATVIMDRLIALWALVWFVALVGSACWATGLLETPAASVSKQIIRIAGVVVLVTLSIWVLLGFLPQRRADRFASRLEQIPKIGMTVAELWRAVWMYRCRQWYVAATMLISWVGHVGFVFAFYFAALTLWDSAQGAIPNLVEHFLLVPIGLVIRAAPLFPGGAGIGEAGFGGLYKLFGCAVSLGVMASLVQRVLEWAIGFVGYIIWMRTKSSAPTPVQGSEPLATAAPSEVPLS